MTVPELHPTDPPNWDGIPERLRVLPRWGTWRNQLEPDKKDPNKLVVRKVPYAGNYQVSAYDPTKWLGFDITKATCLMKGGIGYSGPRITLGKLDKRPFYLIGIDIDTCLGPDGKPSAWALALMAWLACAYAEISPSGTGIKVFAVIHEDDLDDAKRILGMGENDWAATFNPDVPHDGAHKPGAVVYLAKRYFTVTGWQWPDALHEIEQLRLGDLHALAAVLPARAAPNGHDKPNGHAKPRSGPKDTSRSAKAFGAAVAILKYGLARTVDELREALLAHDDADVRDWASEVDDRQIRRLFERAREGTDDAGSGMGGGGAGGVGGGGDDVGGGGGHGGGGTGDVGGDKSPPPVNWLRMLSRGGRSAEPHASVGNAVIALKHAPELIGLVAFDDMERSTVVLGPIPGSDHVHTKFPRPIKEVDATEIQIWIQRNGRIHKMGRDAVFQAIEVVAHNNLFHPVKDYLGGLAWDGVGRLDDWLVRYCGAPDTPYTRKVGRIMLIAMVARIYEPGCQCDYVPVLQGEQGMEKSKLLRVLAGRWFDDHMPAISGGDDVRTSMHLRGKWLIEISELHAFSKSDIEKLKAFITRPVERFIPKYAHGNSYEDRQCVLIGTTNREVFLRDETGGRRFLPIPIERIDIPGVTDDRDQLFAEAVAAYQGGEHWWPERDFEAEHFKSEQEARFETDVWEDAVRDWLNDQVTGVSKMDPIAAPGEKAFTLAQVAFGALEVEVGRLSHGEGMRIAAIMLRAGWQRRKKLGLNGLRLWIPPGASNPDPMKQRKRS